MKNQEKRKSAVPMRFFGLVLAFVMILGVAPLSNVYASNQNVTITFLTNMGGVNVGMASQNGRFISDNQIQFPVGVTASITTGAPQYVWDAIQNQGMDFLGWFENDVRIGSDHILTFTATHDRVLWAKGGVEEQVEGNQNNHQTQQRNQITVNVVASPANGGTVTGDGTHNYRDIVMLTAIPNPGWIFDGWSVQGQQGIPHTYHRWQMDAGFAPAVNGATFVANFSPADAGGGQNQNNQRPDDGRVNISTVVTNPQGGTVSGYGEFNRGETFHLIATPNRGWYVNWFFHGTNPQHQSGEFHLISDNPWWAEIGQEQHEETLRPGDWIFFDSFFRAIATGDGVFEARFRQFADRADLNNLSSWAGAYVYPSNGGTVSGYGFANQGERFTLTATPNPGWIFDGWAEIWNTDGTPRIIYTSGVWAIVGTPGIIQTDAVLSAQLDFRIGNDHHIALFSQIQTQQAAPNLSTAGTWAHNGIIQAHTHGLIPQNLQTNFTANATRAEFAAFAVALYETVTGREITERATFNDTNDINVQKMGGLGVVGGVGNGNFNPNGTITRQEAAVMLSRLIERIDQPLPIVAPTFADNAQIAGWATQAVGQIQAAGIMGGVGNNQFNPTGQFTREQSIVTMLRLFEELS